MSDQFDDDFLHAKLQQLRTKPIAAIEDCRDVYAVIDETHTTATYRLIVFLCDFVECVRGSTLKRNSLLEHKFWNGPGHKPKEDRFTLVAARFALGARRTKGNRHYERARTYAIVIEHYLELEYSAEEVFEDLHEVTIQGVLDMHKQDGKNDGSQEGNASEPSGRKAVAKNSNMLDSGSTRRSDDGNENSTKQKEEGANNSGNQRPRDTSGQVKGRQTDDDELDRGQADERKKGKRDAGSALNSAPAKGNKPQWKKVDLNEVLPINPGDYWNHLLGMQKEECAVITLRCVENEGFKRYRVERIEPMGGGQDEDD